MKPKDKKKKLTVFDILSNSDSVVYPQNLAKLIDSKTYPHQMQKAEYLLDIWIECFKNMTQIDKSRYYSIIPQLLKTLHSIFITKNKCFKTIVILYYLNYKKWNELTTCLQKGLKQSKINCLILIWYISSCMIQPMNQQQNIAFGRHLSQQFEQALSKYKWKTHREKIFILQCIKFINSHEVYETFINNGKKWAEIIKMIKEEEFKSQIIEGKKIQLFKYQFEKKKRIHLEVLLNATKGTKTARKQTLLQKVAEAENSSPQLQLEKASQKQFLSGHQLNVFLVVKNQEEEKEIYHIQLLSEIINCRELLQAINDKFWEALCLEAVIEIYKKMDQLNANVRTNLLLSYLFLNVLKYKKTAQIIRYKIGEEILVKMIRNIEDLGEKSPFQYPQLEQIPTLVNEAFLLISPQDAQKGITVESILTKRISSIISNGNAGRDDLVSRSLMTISCRQEIILKKVTLLQIANFLINGKKKKGLSIETFIILVKIMISSQNSEQFKKLQIFFPLALILTELSELYITAKKVNEFRKQNIKLLKIILPLIAVEESEYNLLISCILKWFQVAQKYLLMVFSPMIEVLTILLNRYVVHFKINVKSVESVEKICDGIKQTLGHQHNSQNMYQFLNFLLTAFIKLDFSAACVIYSQIPLSSFIDWQIIYRKQTESVLKKQLYTRFIRKQKQQVEKIKKEKQKKLLAFGPAVQQLLREQPKIQTIVDNCNYNSSVITAEQLAKEKRCHDIMSIYFGEKEKSWLKDLIVDFQVWNNEYIIISEFGVLEFIILQTMEQVERVYYSKTTRPNQFWKSIIKQIDGDVCKLYQQLMLKQSYQLLFLFGSKIYMHCRDFFFVVELQSYKMIQKKCFEILSIFFNKAQILYASSFFCSLILPHAHNSSLKQVYQYLNREQFITDLFKGSELFIGKEKKYFPWQLKILMAFQATEQFRSDDNLVKQALKTVGKNVEWWAINNYIIDSQINIQQFETEDEKRRLILDIYKKQYINLVSRYYQNVQVLIRNKIEDSKKKHVNKIRK